MEDLKKGDKVLGVVPIIGKIKGTDIIGKGECECVGTITDIIGDFYEVYFKREDNKNLNVDEIFLGFFKDYLKFYDN